jgi:hypothetical protein
MGWIRTHDPWRRAAVVAFQARHHEHVCHVAFFYRTQSQTRKEVNYSGVGWATTHTRRRAGVTRQGTTQDNSSRRDASAPPGGRPRCSALCSAVSSDRCVARDGPHSKPNRYDAPDQPRHVACPTQISSHRTAPESRRGVESARPLAPYVGLYSALFRARRHSAPIPLRVCVGQGVALFRASTSHLSVSCGAHSAVAPSGERSHKGKINRVERAAKSLRSNSRAAQISGGRVLLLHAKVRCQVVYRASSYL